MRLAVGPRYTVAAITLLALTVGPVSVAAAAVAGEPARLVASFDGPLPQPERGAETATIEGDITWTSSASYKGLYIGVYDPATDQFLNSMDSSYVSSGGKVGQRTVYVYETLEVSLDRLDGYERDTYIPGCECKLVVYEEDDYGEPTAPEEYVTLATWNLYRVTSVDFHTEASARSAVEGSTLSFSLREDSTWSDGETTSAAVGSDDRGWLDKRVVGSSAWTEVDWDEVHAGRVVQDVDADYRFVLWGSVPTRPVAVDVIRSTATRKLSAVSATPTRGPTSVSVVVTASRGPDMVSSFRCDWGPL